ncbi:MAG: cell division protein FtsA [Gemmatimonadota bacterium]|nr:MAG: cell division protein FtsA [Gemmatimonadota bacterium]
MGNENSVIVGLDIGTTKIGVIVAEIGADGEVRIVGVGTSPSEGLRRGVVVNVEKTVQSIKTAVARAERSSGKKISSVYAGIAGDHIRSINSRGVIAVSRGDHEITPGDVRRVIDAAKAVAIPMDREIIHVLPQGYVVDDQSGIKDPVGMAGVRLEAEVHIVTGAVTSAQNIYNSIRKAGLEVKDLVLQPLASSYAVLSQDEMELGVGLLDIGGGTTDIALFFEGSIRHTAVIGFGGRNVTNDIAIGLRTPVDKAEEIKIEKGCALQTMMDKDEVMEVESTGGRPSRQISRSVLCSVIEPRVEEIFSLARREIKKSDYAGLLTTGIVITGGSSLIEGSVELAEQVFDLPVKLGVPQEIGETMDEVKSPVFSTGIGLIHYAQKHRTGDNGFWDISESNPFEKILERMKGWFRDFF